MAERGTWHGRMTRRTAFRGAAVGAAGLTGAALIGCDSGGPRTEPAKTSATPDNQKPQRGGIFRTAVVSAPDHFDILSATAASTCQAGVWAYSTLHQWTAGDGQFATGKMEGDLVKQWEQPDELHYVLKLRDGVTWDKRAPTSGRALDADDVVLSWQKFEKKGRYRADVANSVTGAGSIKAIKKIDDRTLGIELAFPDVIALPALSWQNNFFVYPKESMSGGFDPLREMRGTGPFTLKENRPGVGYSFERNPNWHGAQGPWFDGVDVAVISDPAQWEAQFRAGNIHEGIGSTANIPIVAREVKDSKIVTAPPPGVGGTISLNWIPNAPFHDIRVRRAISMSIDRNAILDVYHTPAAYKPLGIKLNNYWFNPVSPAYGEFWLDPLSSKFGPAARYLSHDVAEAKKLLTAAGYSNSKPLEYDIIEHPTSRENRAELLQAMWEKAGIKTKITPADYNSEWQKYISAGRGYTKWKTGRPVVLLKTNTPNPDVLHWLTRFLASDGSLSVTGDEFPELSKMIFAARGVSKWEDRVQRVHDIQRYAVEQMVAPPYHAMTEATEIYQKGVRGPERYQRWLGFENYGAVASVIAPYYWLDETLRKK